MLQHPSYNVALRTDCACLAKVSAIAFIFRGIQPKEKLQDLVMLMLELLCLDIYFSTF